MRNTIEIVKSYKIIFIVSMILITMYISQFIFFHSIPSMVLFHWSYTCFLFLSLRWFLLTRLLPFRFNQHGPCYNLGSSNPVILKPNALKNLDPVFDFCIKHNLIFTVDLNLSLKSSNTVIIYFPLREHQIIFKLGFDHSTIR